MAVLYSLCPTTTPYIFSMMVKNLNLELIVIYIHDDSPFTSDHFSRHKGQKENINGGELRDI